MTNVLKGHEDFIVSHTRKEIMQKFNVNYSCVNYFCIKNGLKPIADRGKAARKASAQKMMGHKKAAIKTLVEFAKRMNPDGKDAAVKEAADYLSGEAGELYTD